MWLAVSASTPADDTRSDTGGSEQTEPERSHRRRVAPRDVSLLAPKQAANSSVGRPRRNGNTNGVPQGFSRSNPTKRVHRRTVRVLLIRRRRFNRPFCHGLFKWTQAAGLGEFTSTSSVQQIRPDGIPAHLLRAGLHQKPVLPTQRAGEHLHSRHSFGLLLGAASTQHPLVADQGHMVGRGALSGVSVTAAGLRALSPLHEPRGRRARLPHPAKARRVWNLHDQHTGGSAHCLHYSSVLPIHPHCCAVSLHPAVQPRHLLRCDGPEQRSPAALLRLAGAFPLLLLPVPLGGCGRWQPHLTAPLHHNGRTGCAGRGHQHRTHPRTLPSGSL